jgi:hypothetical protein
VGVRAAIRAQLRDRRRIFFSASLGVDYRARAVTPGTKYVAYFQIMNYDAEISKDRCGSARTQAADAGDMRLEGGRCFAGPGRNL